MYESLHIRSCGYCRRNDNAAKLAELYSAVKGFTLYRQSNSSSNPNPSPRTKGASFSISDIEKQIKLDMLAKIIKGGRSLHDWHVLIAVISVVR
jgi:hypothetical protein